MIFELANDSCNNFFSANSTGYKIPNFVGCLPAVLFTMFPANISWSSRCLEDVFKTCFEDIFNTSSAYQFFVFEDILKTSCKRLQDILWDVFKTSWKTKNCYIEDVLKTCTEDVLEINKMFTGISVSNHGLLTNLNQYLTNLYLTNLYFINLRWIQVALIRTH